MSITRAARPPVASVDQYLTLAHASLRFRDEGSGPVVVLLHGWTLDLQMWDRQVARLRGDFRIVRFDRRGHGLSDGVPSAAADLADLIALCDRLGLDRLALIGMSQGARSALAFAACFPGRVSAMVLDAPPGLDAAPDDVPLGHFQAVARERGMAQFRQEWLHHPLTRLRSADAQAHALPAAMVGRFAGRELTGDAPYGDVPALQSASSAVPALVLNGALDVPSRLGSAAGLAEVLHAERAIIAGAGHLSSLDRPDEYSDVCRHFLQRYAGAPRAPEEPR